MTAPTVPTAPLPSELEAAIERMDSFGGLKGSPTWKTIRTALLSALSDKKDTEDSLVAYVNNACKEYDRKCAYIVRLRKQLAASERTCAELRADNERMGAETLKCAQIIGNAMCELAGIPPDEGLHIGHLPDMCRDYVQGSQEADWQLEAACAHWIARAEAAERTVEGLRERADVEVCCAQAVEFAEYVTEHAKGKMVEAAQRFLSLPYSQELAAKLKRAPSA